jgi:hypothetical protein
VKSAERRRQENQNLKKVSREEVAQRAYQLWQAAGQPFGRDLEYWLQAEAELLAARQCRPMEVGAAKTGPELEIAGACMRTGLERGAQRLGRRKVASTLSGTSGEPRGSKLAGSKRRQA